MADSRFGSCTKKRNALANCKSALPYGCVLLAKNSENFRGVRCNGIALYDASSCEAVRPGSRKLLLNDELVWNFGILLFSNGNGRYISYRNGIFCEICSFIYKLCCISGPRPACFRHRFAHRIANAYACELDKPRV